tara:strand:- start:154 stop:396 length:243 start_codon:yes stop_codon:yes gene_type:complete
MKCSCGNEVEAARVEFGFKNCKSCAFSNPVSKYKGTMNWSHKTAPTIQVMTAEVFAEQKKYYMPNGARSAVKNFSKHICA